MTEGFSVKSIRSRFALALFRIILSLSLFICLSMVRFLRNLLTKNKCRAGFRYDAINNAFFFLCLRQCSTLSAKWCARAAFLCSFPIKSHLFLSRLSIFFLTTKCKLKRNEHKMWMIEKCICKKKKKFTIKS